MTVADLIILAAEQAPPAPSSMNQIVVAALGAGGLGAVIAAIITGLFSKRKLGAEATEIITKAASGVVENLNAEIVRVNAALEAVRVEGAASEARHVVELAAQEARHARVMEDIRRVLQLHAAWDVMAVAKLAEQGISMPEPPPLRPPLLGRDSE